MPKFVVTVETVIESMYSVEADSAEDITIKNLETAEVIEEYLGWIRFGKIRSIEEEETDGDLNPRPAIKIEIRSGKDFIAGLIGEKK